MSRTRFGPAVLKFPAPFQRGVLGPDQRREPRYPTNDAALIRLLPMENASPLMPGIVRDVSKSGLRLEIRVHLARGSRIEVLIPQPREMLIIGTVRYCRCVDDVLHAGILVHEVFLHREQDRHLDDDARMLYISGAGLTSSELIGAELHLAECGSCAAKLTETAGELRSTLRSVTPKPVWQQPGPWE